MLGVFLVLGFFVRLIDSYIGMEIRLIRILDIVRLIIKLLVKFWSCFEIM